jgi:large subunit ribosomal protein L25
MHNLDHEAFYSHILTLKVGDDSEKVVLKDLQRHPYKRVLLHIDLLRIDANETLNMRVPLHYINEEKCAGVKNDGGVISHLISELEIVCLPKDLPEYIEVDMLEVNVGDTVHLTELKLPEGVQIYDLLHGQEEDQPVASVHLPRVVTEEETEAEEGIEAAAPDEDKDSEDKES